MKDLMHVTKLVMLQKRDILISIVCGFIAGIAAVGLFAASGYLVSKAAFAPPLYALIVLTSTVKLLGFVRALSKYAERYFSHRATFTILSDLRVSFFEKIEPLAPAILTKYRSGDLLSRIVGDVESLQNYFLRVLYPPIVLVMVFLSTVLFTTFFSIYIAGILLVGLLLTTFLVPGWFALKQAKIDHHVRLARGELSTEVTEYFQGFRDLKVYQTLAVKEREVNDKSEQYLKDQEQESINKVYNQALNTFVTLIITWLVLGIGAYLVSDGQLDGIFLAMLVMISLTVFEDIGPMGVFPIYMQDTKVAAERLFSVVRKEEAGSSIKKEPITFNESPAIEMNNVHFTFPGEWRTTINNVTLSIESGSKVAIVGPSGSGKSTLLQLILQHFQVDQGEIVMNGTSLHDVNPASIWENTRVILQENHFFYGTIRDNLLLAGEGLSDEEMIHALEIVKLAHFSLDTLVIEKGDNLSGGERQRLAIARAMLKKGKLWLLDEPTSSIDALTEQYIYNHIFEQAKDATMILVSHRLTGLEKMDQIIVMEQGAIMESGTYEQLLAAKGYFYELKAIEKHLL